MLSTMASAKAERNLRIDREYLQLGGSARLFRNPQIAENLHQQRENAALALDTLHALKPPASRSLQVPVKATVLIRPKEGILDPQGQAVEEALPALGFKGVSHVHVGRLVELQVEDPSQIESMCEKLLANPLIEDYEIVTGS